MSVKLVYFNLRGLAEVSRLLLALAQVNYEDYRFPFEVIDLQNHLFKRDEFDSYKANGYLDCSMGKLPILEITDGLTIHRIPQSKAIERYLSKKYGFMGNNLIEEAKIDSICECVRDIKDRYQKVRSGTDAEKEHYFNVELKNELDHLEKVILCHEPTHSQFSVGDKLSLADVVIYHFVTQFYDNKKILDIAGRMKKIREVVMEVAKRPQIIVWLQTRPRTQF